MKKSLLGLLVASGLSAYLGYVSVAQAKKAEYFRAWQGYALTNKTEMLNVLPDFMDMTIDLYAGQNALSNYIVIVPPLNAPGFVPDELALVALTSETEYRAIREIPEGKYYGEAHWQVFNKENSKSAQMLSFSDLHGAPLVHNVAYNVIGKTIDWSRGKNYVFIGTRKGDLSADQFLNRLKAHVALAKDVMGPKGLRGYIIIANENYEIAYLNWSSEIAHNLALETESAKAVFKDAQDIMDILMYVPVETYKPGTPILMGNAYQAFGK